MSNFLNKLDRARIFAERLQQALEHAEISKASLARSIAVSRSTVSQLLHPDTARVPNGQVVAACAAQLGVSSDWLLGLSDRPERAEDIALDSSQMSQAQRAFVDEQIFEWHKEAAGYKIRHVPATLPDMLKTRAVLDWEYAPYLGPGSEAAIVAAQGRLDWMTSGRSDYELALPQQELTAFARAEGYYRDLPLNTRLEQLRSIAALYDRLYPALRISLFDARLAFSAPVTVFGPRMAVLYVGSHYLAFRDSTRVQMLSAHFDGLVRQATVPDTSFGTYLAGLLGETPGTRFSS